MTNQRYNITTNYRVEPVVDDMLEIFAHADLSHQLVLVSIHSSQLSNMSKRVLNTISKLKRADLKRFEHLEVTRRLYHKLTTKILLFNYIKD